MVSCDKYFGILQDFKKQKRRFLDWARNDKDVIFRVDAENSDFG